MMADYIFTQHGNNNVQIGDVAGMDYSVKTALKWALEQNFQSVAAQYARTLGYEVDRQIKEITALREDITSARSEQARLQSENETLWGEIGYVNGDQVDAARFFHEQRNEIAALRAENADLSTRNAGFHALIDMLLRLSPEEFSQWRKGTIAAKAALGEE